MRKTTFRFSVPADIDMGLCEKCPRCRLRLSEGCEEVEVVVEARLVYEGQRATLESPAEGPGFDLFASVDDGGCVLDAGELMPFDCLPLCVDVSEDHAYSRACDKYEYENPEED